jgi:hypothetical protein
MHQVAQTFLSVPLICTGRNACATKKWRDALVRL